MSNLLLQILPSCLRSNHNSNHSKKSKVQQQAHQKRHPVHLTLLPTTIRLIRPLKTKRLFFVTKMIIPQEVMKVNPNLTRSQIPSPSQMRLRR